MIPCDSRVEICMLENVTMVALPGACVDKCVSILHLVVQNGVFDTPSKRRVIL